MFNTFLVDSVLLLLPESSHFSQALAQGRLQRPAAVCKKQQRGLLLLCFLLSRACQKLNGNVSMLFSFGWGLELTSSLCTWASSHRNVLVSFHT
jgi:hypothetical protein